MFFLTGRNRGLVAIAIAFGVCVLGSTAKSQNLLPLSENSQFRTSLEQWNTENGNATVDQPGTGKGRLKLSGESSVWQYVPASGLSEYQLLNCEGFKSAKSGLAGWAGIGVIYYDAQWGFIDSFEKQINESRGLDIEGQPIMNPCSLGVRVPPNAVHSIIWAANDAANTTTYIDNLVLLDYFKSYPGYQGAIADGPNLDGTFPSYVADLFGQVHALSGLQFWNLSGSIDMGTGAIGTVGTPSSIAQELQLKPGSSYSITFFSYTARDPNAAANAGVDYFDANWQKIGGTIIPLAAYNSSNADTFETDVPAGAVHSVLWVWVDALTANVAQQQFGPFYNSIFEIDATPPVVSLKQPIPNRTSSDTGLQVLLSYSDDLEAYPTLDNAKISLLGPSGVGLPIFATYEVSINSENPLNKTMILRVLDVNNGFQPIEWSRFEPGQYTFVVSPDAVRDIGFNGNTNEIRTTFQLTP